MLGKIKEYLRKNTKYGKSRYLNFLYDYDLKQYFNNSCMNEKNPERMATEMRILVHAIEKGMSLPECKVGFGKQKVLQLIALYNNYSKVENKKDEQVLHLVKSVLRCYKDFQTKKGVVVDFIPQELLVCDCQTIQTGAVETKVHKSTNFSEIALGRHSCRAFADKNISNDLIKQIVSLAQTAPSACNRQSIRIYACTNKEKIDQIFDMHCGIRGFSKPAVVFVITGDLALYLNEYERNTLFVDGGIYLMNLLYAIDSFGLASCPVIWGSEPSGDKKLCELLNIPKHEKIISLALAGYHTDDTYLAAASAKRDIDTVLTIIQE